MNGGFFVHVLFLLVICSFAYTVQCACPYSDATLKPWGTASTWPGSVIPASGANVVIGAGMNVVLNVSPPPLSSVRVTNGGRLIWGNYNGLEIISGSVTVDAGGEFWIGSEDCPFTLSATITLTGSAASTNVTGFGNKVLGCGANGTLELHGAAYSAWTKLAANVIPVSWTPTNAPGRGINIAAFDPFTGATIDYKQFDTFADPGASNNLTVWLSTKAAGTVIALVCADECTNMLSAAAKTALQNIGSVNVTALKYRSGWACVGVQGAAPGTAFEDIKNETSRPTVVVTRPFSKFQVSVQAYSPYSGLIKVLPSGSPVITLANSVNWQVGQQVVISSTDNVYTHAEQNEIIACSGCAANQIQLRYALNWTHWGQFENGVDERAEIGLLSRSILVRGQMADGNDTWGAQTKILNRFKNAHIENVQFFQAGQPIIGAYPVHFHMTFDVDAVGGYTKPAYVKNCAIHKTFNRCITVHGTMGLLVQNNVAYDHMGHCYFLEDGSEIRNILDRNLGIMTKYGTVLLSDRNPASCNYSSYCLGPATFWIENPNNILTNNVAAGSVAFGIWYIFPSHPTGLSYPYFANVSNAYVPLGVCNDNTAHSSPNGFLVDDGVVVDPADPNYLGIAGARYRPHTLPNLSSLRVIANFNRTTIHHCQTQGMWLRGGDFRVYDSFFADNVISVTLASEGTNPNDPGSAQQVINTVFVGITNNNYSALINGRIRGFDIYDGPVAAINCTFYRFPDTGRNSSAFTGHANNFWQVGSTNFLTNIKLNGVAKNLYYQEPVNDGDRNNIIRDLDGSVSGKPGYAIVTNLPIHATKTCITRTDFNALVCPQKYGQIFIMNQNITGTVLNGVNPTMTLYRDEKSAYPLSLTGIGSAQPKTQFQPLVLINKTYTLHFGHASPPALAIQLNNFDPKDAVRIGICYPSGSSFIVRSRVGNTIVNLSPVSSLAALDAFTNSTATSGYYWDNSTGLLFVKIIAFNPRIGYYYCGSLGCESIEIRASGPNLGSNSGSCVAYPKYATVEP